jgi:hypothetical protein
MGFSSGRPYASLLSPACTSTTLSFSDCGLDVNGALTGNDNLNNTAFNESTSNTGAGHQWRRTHSGNWPEFFLRPMGRENRGCVSPQFCDHGAASISSNTTQSERTAGDGVSLNQTCYLAPNSGPGALQAISPNAFLARSSSRRD